MYAIFVLGIVVSAFGQDPKIKQAIADLTPQVNKLEASVKSLEPSFDKLDELANVMENEKIEKNQAGALMTKAEKIRAELALSLPLMEQAQSLQDTLAVLGKKAKRANKIAIAKLTEKVNASAITLGEAKTGCETIDQIRAKLEEMQSPAKPKGKPEKTSGVLSDKHGIKIGMTKEEVQAKKGDPEKKGFTWWAYPLYTNRDGQRVKAGAIRIDFDEKGKVTGLKEISQ